MPWMLVTKGSRAILTAATLASTDFGGNKLSSIADSGVVFAIQTAMAGRQQPVAGDTERVGRDTLRRMSPHSDSVMTQEQTTPAVADQSSAQSPAEAARALHKELQEKFEVFRDFKPLAVGINKELIARLPEIDRKALRSALRSHTNTTRYLKAMEKAKVRFDLDGNPGEEISDAHRAHAAELLQERFKKKAESQKAQREAEAAKVRTEKLNQLAAKFGRDRK